MTVPLVGQQNEITSMDEIIVPLVNFHARVLDYCVGAAQHIVNSKMVENSAIVQGPDPGPAAGEHPMTGVMAVAMYNQIIEDMRSKRKDLTGENGDGEANQ